MVAIVPISEPQLDIPFDSLHDSFMKILFLQSR